MSGCLNPITLTLSTHELSQGIISLIIRCMNTYLTDFPRSCVQDWPRLLRQSFKHTKPGGYFEIQEFAVRAWSDDGTLKEDSPYAQYLKCLDEAGKKVGKELNIYDRLKQWVIDAGYTDVVEKVYILPLAPWPKDPTLKELGRWQAIGAQDAVEAYGLRLYTQVLGWSAEEAKVHYEMVKEQLRDRKVHAYTKMYVSPVLFFFSGSNRDADVP